MRNIDEIDDEEFENDEYDEEMNDVSYEPECPVCHSEGDCEHVLATFGVTEGTVSGPICKHIDEMLNSIAGFILKHETFPPPLVESSSYGELREAVTASRDAGDSLGDALDAEYGLALGVLRDILEDREGVSWEEYEIDESSGTWGYMRYYAADPNQVIAEVNQYLSSNC
ncbi:hypothetical protein C8R21_13022 [Nitrosospira multiformis]|uniref:Uncharacterized protein n=1 Tax=Nitrosospira multiformis TaxID=1231 RepID=A0A2T5I674_9PROT|nr:hypothetical protein [Nitrosospira multiformis]PTQ79310.1 hypothetical protein C8R21_13022 [Nitrosospira multiformis]